jgi:type I restriction enzyme, S subunit
VTSPAAPDLYSPEFPADWEAASLYSLATWVNGLAFKNIDFADAGRPVVKIAEIKNGLSSQTRYTAAQYDDKYRITNGDFLFAWSGQPETSIDAYWWRGPAAWLNQHIFKILPDATRVDRGLFFQILKYLRPNFVRIARNKQTTGLGHVTKTDLERLTVRIPQSKAEQEVLASTLGALDDKIMSNQRTCALLEAEAQTLFESIFDVEQQESGQAISELVEVNPQRPLKRGVLSTYIGMADVPSGGALIYSWAPREMTSGQRFSNGDVLFARITPCLENGKTAMVDMLESGEVGWGSTEFVVLHPGPAVSTPWVYCLVRTEPVRNFAIRNMSGSSGRQRFPASAFDTYALEPPAPLAVEEFNALAIPSFERMTQLRDETKRLSALLDALRPELLSGRLRVSGLSASETQS